MENQLICFILVLSFFYLNSACPPAYGQCDISSLYLKPPCCGAIEESNSRILGGKIVEINKYPWMVYIPQVGCGGSLINHRFVLSAAHCFPNVHGYYEVQLGTTQANGYGPNAKTIPVEKVIKHEQFDLYHGLNNIALLKLSSSVDFSDSTKPICLPYKTAGPFDFVQKNAVVAGWGAHSNGPSSQILQEATVQVWDQCKPYLSTTENNKICAGGVHGTGACLGDYGGPLFLQLPKSDESNSYWIQIGIVSAWIYETCLDGVPSIYSNLTTQMNWIEYTLGQNQ